MGIGEIKNLHWKGIPRAEQMECDLGIKFGVFTGYDDPYLKKFMQASATPFLIFTCPDKKIDDIWPVLVYITFALVLDDQVDHDSFFTRRPTFQELTVVKEKMLEVVHGLKDPEEQDVDFEFPKMKPLCRYLAYIRDMNKETAPTPEHFDRWVKDLHDYFNGIIADNAFEWYDYKSKCKTGTHARAHWEIRRWDSG